MNIDNIIKEYNEYYHFPSDLKDDEWTTLDESEIDGFISWAIQNEYGDLSEYFYETTNKTNKQ